MFILASASPRRQELLRFILDDFAILTVDVDESWQGNPTPEKLVEMLSYKKAKGVFDQHPTHVVIGADTVVALEDEVLGKPKDKDDAYKMLEKLSGKEHTVYTGVSILSPNKEDIFAVATKVKFAPLSHMEILEYINTGEPMDKAGAYGIQGFGAKFIEGLEGDYFNVVGLPVRRVYLSLKDFL